jgi:uncharacterized protein (TIGR02145 family)
MKYKNPKFTYWIIFGFAIALSCSCSKNDDPKPEITATDIDGNVYKTITLGTQTWMAENLKTTRYNDGTIILYATDTSEWLNATTGAFSYYNNDEVNNKDVYGGLYNWYAVETGKLCPTGWHVPTKDDWYILFKYLHGKQGGYKLKEDGTSHWMDPNRSATNETGFTALPGGVRDNIQAKFWDMGYIGYWWSSTEFTEEDAYYYGLYTTGTDIFESPGGKNCGRSVRCLKDN